MTRKSKKSDCWLGDRVSYRELSGKEQESYNAAKLRALMAEWGYLESVTVNVDKHGADLLFYRSSDGCILKVQLKGRPTLAKAYKDKDIYVAFQDKKTGSWYVYNHDVVLEQTLEQGKLAGSKSWDIQGSWSWSAIPSWLHTTLMDWRIPNSAQTAPFIDPQYRGEYPAVDFWGSEWEMT